MPKNTKKGAARTHIHACTHAHTRMHACTYTHARTHIHTLQVAPKVLKAVQTACKLYGVRNVDLWSNLLVSVCMCV